MSDIRIAPRMTLEAMRERMRIFLDLDWSWQARNVVEDLPDVSREQSVLTYAHADTPSIPQVGLLGTIRRTKALVICI
jgi:hypothetical protein